MKLTRVYSCLTLVFLTIFTIGCSAINHNKNVVDLSTNSAKADEQPVGDFNGDSKPDIAVMLKDKTPKNNAFSVMAIFPGGTKKVIVIDDLNKLGADDIWEVVYRE
jgi:hypothetical protein